MVSNPEYNPGYRPTNSRSSLNFAEKTANHLIASVWYGCGTVALGIRHLDKVLELNIRYPGEVVRGYERFYKGLDIEGQLPFRPLIHPKK